MDKEKILEFVKKARESSKKRNFSQTFDLVVSLKNLNLKKPEEQVDFFMQLPKSKGKNSKVCAFVGAELKESAKEVCDHVIDNDQFEKLEKNDVKKLASEYDFFIAQANIMSKVAKAFGRVLGPRGKMPNPKAGCVVPPKANLKPLYDKLQYTVRLQAKTKPVVQISAGKEDMKDEDIAENIASAYNNLIHHLPKEENNIRSVTIKTTMGKPVRVEK
ncbi:MAG: 50S ribosomal protein L1 [Nanobdellota archaeon]